MVFIKNSLKQLFRTPAKALVFFLLMAACTLLLVVSSVLLAETVATIERVDSEFTTIGTVEQAPVSSWTEETYNECLGAHGNVLEAYDELLTVDVLNFEGANYIGEPESRAYYMTVQNWGTYRAEYYIHNDFLVTFSPLEDCGGEKPVEAEVLDVWYSNVWEQLSFVPIKNLRVGDIIPVCQHFSTSPTPLEAGKKYTAALVWRSCGVHGNDFPGGEYVVYQSPHTTQYDKNGSPVSDGKLFNVTGLYETADAFVFRAGASQNFPAFDDESLTVREIKEGEDDLPTEDGWFSWFRAIEQQYRLFPVLSTNDLALLPSFHENTAQVTMGRAITEEEFQSGAAVCMVSDDFINDVHLAGLSIGGTVSLPLLCALYNYDPGKQFTAIKSYSSAPFMRRFSLLDANGDLYSPFCNVEYTIVGAYHIDEEYFSSGAAELIQDAIIVPTKSIPASDENNIAYFGPMNDSSTSFRIPNGTIEEFDKSFRASVPEAAKLTITYDDNGYTDIMSSLNATRTTSLLLFFAGLISAAAVIALLLYVFIVKQKKRTAIERGLGLSDKQCRVSLLSGVLILALAAVICGTAGGAALSGKVHTGEKAETEFSTRFSDWSEVSPEAETSGETDNISALYAVVPISVWSLAALLALVLMRGNLRAEPIELLGRKQE